MDTKSSNVLSGEGGVDSSPEVSAPPLPFPTKEDIENLAADVRSLRYSLQFQIQEIVNIEFVLNGWSRRAALPKEDV